MKSKFTFALFALFAISSNAQICSDTLQYIFSDKTAQRPYYYYFYESASYPGFAQYFDAPDSLVLKGIQFYAGMELNDDSALVNVIIRKALADSTIDAEILGTTSLWISDTIDWNDPEAMRQRIQFDPPIKIGEPYYVVLETKTDKKMAVVGNNYKNSDGQGENLSMSLSRKSGNSLWGRVLEDWKWDLDFQFEPMVEYAVDNNLELEVSGACGDSVSASIGLSPFVTNRMYNYWVGEDGKVDYSSVSIDWGDGSVTNYPDTVHAYAQEGDYDVKLSVKHGWDFNMYDASNGSKYCVTETSSSIVYIGPISDTSRAYDYLCGRDSVEWNGKKYGAVGEYQITLQGVKGCDSVVIFILDSFKLDSVVLNEIICPGDSVRMGSFHYKEEGAYTDTLKNQSGCDSIVYLNIKIDSIWLSATSEEVNAGNAGRIDLNIDSGGYEPFTYVWNNGAGPVQDPSGLSNGEYFVTVTDSLGCTSALTVIVDKTTGTDLMLGENLAKVFPTLASDYVEISIEGIVNKVDARVFSVGGRLMDQFQNIGNSFRIPVSRYKSGMYILTVESGAETMTVPFMKR